MVAVALVLSSTSSHAWDFAETSRGDPVRWFMRAEPLPFKLGAIEPEELSVELVTAVVQTAWDTWHNAGCADVPTAVYRGVSEETEHTVPQSFREAPDNLVLFVRTADEWSALGRGTNEIAITLVSNSDKTGEIVDADIVVNDALWRFTVGGGSVAPGEVDFVSAMTHEVGHALGLLHSLELDATMYATYTSADPAGARSLSDDDRAGLCALYQGVPVHLQGRLVEACGAGGVGAWGWLFAVALLACRARARA